jgi:hypothetical protein
MVRSYLKTYKCNPMKNETVTITAVLGRWSKNKKFGRVLQLDSNTFLTEDALKGMLSRFRIPTERAIRIWIRGKKKIEDAYWEKRHEQLWNDPNIRIEAMQDASFSLKFSERYIDHFGIRDWQLEDFIRVLVDKQIERERGARGTPRLMIHIVNDVIMYMTTFSVPLNEIPDGVIEFYDRNT